MATLLKEIFLYFRQRKKILLLPIILVFLVFGAALIATQGTVIAPFIYTVF